MVGTVQHRLEGGKEKGGGGRGSDGFRVELGLGQRGVKWSERFEGSRVEWSGMVNAPRLTTGRK